MPLISIQLIKDSDATLLRSTNCWGKYTTASDSHTGQHWHLTLLYHHLAWIPSITCINAGIAIEVFHMTSITISSIQAWAPITLADWMLWHQQLRIPSGWNGLNKNFTHYYQKVPTSWIIAQKIMSKLEPKLSLRLTDFNYILKGNVPLHTYWIFVNWMEWGAWWACHVLFIFKKDSLLSDARNWLHNLNGHLTFAPYRELASQSKWTKAGEAN